MTDDDLDGRLVGGIEVGWDDIANRRLAGDDPGEAMLNAAQEKFDNSGGLAGDWERRNGGWS